jgi:hypothetical protein
MGIKLVGVVLVVCRLRAGSHLLPEVDSSLYKCVQYVDVFFSRPESGMICMKDGDFVPVRVVGDKERRKKERRRRNNFVIGEN